MRRHLYGLLNKIIRFMGCGAICGAIDYVLMIVLTEALDVNYLISAAIAYIFGTTLNYFISSRFVFEHKEKKTYDLPVFLFLGTIALVLNIFIMWLVTEELGIAYFISKFAASAVSGLWNFVSRKLLLERHLHRPQDPPEAHSV